MNFELANLQEIPVPSHSWFSDVLTAVEVVAGPLVQLSIALVDDDHLAALHEQFLGDPKKTDVMSFPLDEDEGEVVISVTMAQTESERLGCPMEEELALYLVHGTLHLLGYDDLQEEQKREMVAREKEVLGRLGIVPRER